MYAVVAAMRSVSLLAIAIFLASYGETKALPAHPHQPVLRLIIEKPNLSQHYWGEDPHDFKLRVLNPRVDTTKSRIQTDTDENEGDEQVSRGDTWDDIPIFNIDNDQWGTENHGADTGVFREFRPVPLRSKARAMYLDRDRRDPSLTLQGPGKESGMIFNMESFFGRLHNNLDSVVGIDPQNRAVLFAAPSVVQSPIAQESSGVGGGVGISKLNTLRPLRPTSNIRSYNRRSVMGTDHDYPTANRHNPGLLWMGLGR